MQSEIALHQNIQEIETCMYHPTYDDVLELLPDGTYILNNEFIVVDGYILLNNKVD
jgi:hypothetical protein